MPFGRRGKTMLMRLHGKPAPTDAPGSLRFSRRHKSKDGGGERVRTCCWRVVSEALSLKRRAQGQVRQCANVCT